MYNSSAYSCLFLYLLLILRVQNSELGVETDQLSDGGCALDVYGMRRTHQVVGPQKELLRDCELTLAPGCRGTQPR